MLFHHECCLRPGRNLFKPAIFMEMNFLMLSVIRDSDLNDLNISAQAHPSLRLRFVIIWLKDANPECVPGVWVTYSSVRWN